MSIKCITRILDENNKEICALYRHNDGSLSNHGVELLQFLKKVILTTDKITKFRKSAKQSDTIYANGMYCLAALIIAHFKKGPYTFYLFPPGISNMGEEYDYSVYLKDEKLYLLINLKTKELKTILNCSVDEIDDLNYEEHETNGSWSQWLSKLDDLDIPSETDNYYKNIVLENYPQAVCMKWFKQGQDYYMAIYENNHSPKPILLNPTSLTEKDAWMECYEIIVGERYNLAPCPLCSGAADVFQKDVWIFIQCKECGLKTSLRYDTENDEIEHLIQYWNRR